MTHIGLIGLGKMGGNMRQRLRNNGVEVTGYARSRDVSDVDSIADLDALAAAINRLTSAPQTLTLQDLALLGMSQATAETLANIQAAMADGSASYAPINSVADLSAAVTAGLNAYTTALAVIRDYAQSNTGTLPVLSTFTQANVSGVDASNLGFVQQALASAALVGVDVDTTAEIQALVSAVNALRSSLDGDGSDNDMALSSAQISALGLRAMDTAAEVSLLNDVLDGRSSAQLSSYADLTALANTVSDLKLAALGSAPAAPLTVTRLTALGLNNVSDLYLAAILERIEATANDGSGVDTMVKLQAIVDAAAATYNNALGVIGSYDGSNTAPQLQDYLDAEVTGVTSAELAQLNTFVAQLPTASTNTTVLVQGVTDAFNALLAAADSNNATASSLSQAQFVTLGLTAISAAEASLLNTVISGLAPTAVDTYAELAALAAQVNRVVGTASSDSLNNAPSLADLTALGVSGVTAANLAVV